MLTGLGRSDKQPARADDEDADGADDDDDGSSAGGVGRAGKGEQHQQRKRAQQQRDIIQKQLAKIRSKALVAKADVSGSLPVAQACVEDVSLVRPFISSTLVR